TVTTSSGPDGLRAATAEPHAEEPEASGPLAVIESSLRKYPGPWIGAAVAAGMVLGWLVKRR
ncbi:MAG TPA: hypothetical protein VGE52_22165, partial [Pirellulales bacterium]